MNNITPQESYDRFLATFNFCKKTGCKRKNNKYIPLNRAITENLQDGGFMLRNNVTVDGRRRYYFDDQSKALRAIDLVQ